MSNTAKPTRVEKFQKQFTTRMKKVEKTLPAAWDAATMYGTTPEAIEAKSNWRFEGHRLHTAYNGMEGSQRIAIYDYVNAAADLHRTLSDLQDAFATEAKKAASVVKKAAQEAADLGLRMTCQCCGRDIQSNTGLVAHHGYERPGGGWQTASCDGARELPIEASTSVLEDHIVRQERTLTYLVAELAKIVNEEIQLSASYTIGYGKNEEKVSVFVTRASFEAAQYEHRDNFLRNGWYRFDNLKDAHVRAAERKVENQTDYINWQKGRLEAAQKAGVTHNFNATAGRWEVK